LFPLSSFYFYFTSPSPQCYLSLIHFSPVVCVRPGSIVLLKRQNLSDLYLSLSV
jgi:hypothetical protein